MILRKAELKDFEVYRELYEDKEFRYQWMYYHPIYKDPDMHQILKLESDSFEDLREIMEEYQNYTLKRFEEDTKNHQIFMIENDGKILGYVKTFSCGNGRYKLDEWAMFENNFDVKIRVIQELRKVLPRLKSLEVFITHKPAIDFFILAGFISLPTGFLELEFN